jgi:hypothetical protein
MGSITATWQNRGTPVASKIAPSVWLVAVAPAREENPKQSGQQYGPGHA